MPNALVSIQVIPNTPGGSDPIPYIDLAIGMISDSGLVYRVGPLETTMEGPLSQCLNVVQQINETLIEKGCPNIISQVKVYCPAPSGSLFQLTKKYDPHA
ncbi:MAG: thiamine-binding protein [Firmicutes bacterium]|nr:thiamine-binding protein [Bacillota bacterium]